MTGKVTADQDLLPCPMCGGKAKLVRVNGEWFPKCGEARDGMCLLNRYPVPGHDGFARLEDAVAVWNRRWYPAGKIKAPKRKIGDFERFVHGKHGRPAHLL